MLLWCMSIYCCDNLWELQRYLDQVWCLSRGDRLLFSHSVLSDALWPHGLQLTRLPCPSLISRNLLKLMSIDSMMPSSHLILCLSLLLLLSIFPSIRIFSNSLALHIRWPKYWSFSLIISPANEYLGLISFRIDWFDILSVQGTLESTTIRKHSFISLLHDPILTSILEKPVYGLYGPLLAKWCLCFLICSLLS